MASPPISKEDFQDILDNSIYPFILDTLIPAVVTDIFEDSLYTFLIDTLLPTAFAGLDTLHLQQVRDEAAVQSLNGYFSRWGFLLDTNIDVRSQIWGACYDMANRMLIARELGPTVIDGTKFPPH